MKKKKIIIGLMCMLFLTFIGKNVKAETYAYKGNRDWKWPVSSATLSSCVGDNRNHKGIDIVGTNGVTQIYGGYGSATGYVAGAGYNSTEGNYAHIKVAYKGNYYMVRYMHMSKVLVKAGNSVGSSTQIGVVGNTGDSQGPHLHYEILSITGAQYNAGTYTNAWANVVDPLKCEFLELPSGLNAGGATSDCCTSKPCCCNRYVTEVKKIYSGRNPFGSLDDYSGGNGTIFLRGWVADWDDPGAALGVHVYVGGPAGSGAPGYAITANKTRSDVNNVFPGIGNNHGFEDEIEVSPRGNQKLYIYGLNVGGGENILLASVDVTINEPVHNYYLDINGILDGKGVGDLGNYGTCDVYINGELKADDCNDFYSANGTWKQGSTYEIKDIKATKCHSYEGVYSGSLSGTLNDNTSVSLKFITSHDYSVETTATTCTTLGSKTYTCKNCGNTYTEKDKELLPHDYQEESIDATCTNFAGTKYTCKNCGDTYIKYAEADWSEWSEKYPEGIDERLIESRIEYSYSDKQTTTSEKASLSGWTQTGSEPVYSGWGGWSAWQTDPINSSETVDVSSEKVYRYYYFYCPVCGGREPFQGKSDCNRYTLTLADAHVGWFTLPYSQSNPQSYGYTTAKVYTTAPDGNRWNFSKSNINDTAIGTLDAGEGAVVIATGYRSRTRSRTGTKYYYEKWGEWSDWTTTAVTGTSKRQVKTRTVYRYNKTPYGDHKYEESISGNTLTYKCVNCGKVKEMKAMTVNNKSGILEVKLAATDKITEKGVIYGKESEVTLETPGRTRIAYSELDSDNSYSFDATGLEGYTIRAYVIYQDGNGNSQIIYSD